MIPCNITVLGNMYVETLVKTPKFCSDKEVKAESFDLNCSGFGFLQSTAIAKLGANVKVLGCVGNDLYGKVILSCLKKENVVSDGVRLEGSPTGSMVNINCEVQNYSVYYGGANEKISSEYIESSVRVLRNTDFLVLGNKIDPVLLSTLSNLCKNCKTKIIYSAFNPEKLSKNAVRTADINVLGSKCVTYLTDIDITDNISGKKAAEKLKTMAKGTIVIYSEDCGGIYDGGSAVKIMEPYKSSFKCGGDVKFIGFTAAYVTALSKYAINDDAVDFALYTAECSAVKGQTPYMNELREKVFKDKVERK